MRHSKKILCGIALALLLPAASFAGGQEKAASCAACHGADGNSAAPNYPNLAGQHASYTVQQLKAFKSGARENAIMAGMVAALSEQDMKEIAAWYSTLAPRIGSADPELVARGEQLYRGGDKDAGVPACMACHGPSGAGMPGSAYPLLSGQHAEYTAAQLTAYHDGTRGGAQAAVMQTIAARLSAEDIAALASYLQGLH